MKHKRIAILLVMSFLLSLFTVAVLTINIFAQEETWVEMISERTRNGKKFQGQINHNHFALDLSIGAIHYDSPNWKEINNTLVPSIANVPQLGLADWEMTQDDYEWFALETLNTIPMWLFRNRSAPDSYITFNPQALQWTNDLDQISQVATIVSDTVGQVSDNSIHWEDAYGLGRNLTLFTNPNRMVKHLTLESYPGDPPSFITDGENASFELRFIFDTPSGPNQPDVFVNGILWDRRDRVQTEEEVEFRLGGETLFVFTHPLFFDSDTKSGIGTMVFTRQGGNIIVGVRVPLAFLQSAIYPVMIDPTVDETVGAGADDGYSEDDGNFWDTTTNHHVGEFVDDRDSWLRFTTVAVPNAATIDTAYINVSAYQNNKDGSGTKSNIYGEDADDAVAPTSQANHAAKTRTTNFGVWDDYDFPDTTNYYASPEIKTAIQDIIDREGWSSGNDLQILWDDDGSSVKFYNIRTYEDGNPGKLHIEYTSVSATCEAITVIITNPSGQLFFNGTTDDPTGGLWQEENVSEDFQGQMSTSAINVTNDDTVGACDVTLELLTSPGAGRTMKFNTTSTAPTPDFNNIPVGSNITVVNLASEATQVIWLWIDLDDSQGGSATPTLRVDTELP